MRESCSSVTEERKLVVCQRTERSKKRLIHAVVFANRIGGLRMVADASLDECVRLARAMSLKNAAAGLAHGGGKSVLCADSKLPAERKEELIRAMACALADLQDYIVGPDMGTDETCMGWIHDEIGRAVGLPRELGGILVVIGW